MIQNLTEHYSRQSPDEYCARLEKIRAQSPENSVARRLADKLLMDAAPVVAATAAVGVRLLGHAGRIIEAINGN